MIKYVMFEVNALPTPVIFGETLGHKDIKLGFHPVISAGFLSIDFENRRVNVYGESVSLKIKSNPDDAYWLRKVIFPD